MPKRSLYAASFLLVWLLDMAKPFVDEHGHGQGRQVLHYVLCYVLWFGFAALSFWTILEYRNAVLALLPIIGPWAMGAVDKFGLLLFGLIALVWVLYLENYLRQGVELGNFWKRVARVALVQLVVLLVAYALQLPSYL